MIPSRIVERKRDGETLPPAELDAFLAGYAADEVEDYQMAAFLMAVYFRGFAPSETGAMVRAILASGTVLDLADLDGPVVDKHSTGGVGDKVSLVLAPLAAECGLFVPMMSGRGLGHTTGTLDKLEAIPGFRTDLDLGRFREVLEAVGCAMIGQTPEIAPLDGRLYALRDVTGTVPAIPLIAASIMSKKLAEGLDALLLDVKVGGGAFIPEEPRALELARTMVDVGEAEGLRTVALLTAMDRPLGRAVGNGLETAEAIECLGGEGPDDLRELVVAQAAEMLALGAAAGGGGEPVPADDVRERAADALASGRALERFVRLVEAQGGDPAVVDDPARLHTAPETRTVEATAAGTVVRVAPRVLGEAVVTMGGGRRRMTDGIDPGVGFEVLVRPGDEVERGQPLARVHARDAHGLAEGERAVRASVAFGGDPGPPRPLVSHRVDADGVHGLVGVAPGEAAYDSSSRPG